MFIQENMFQSSVIMSNKISENTANNFQLNKRPLAPAPEKDLSNKKTVFDQFKNQKSQSIARRNARERNRVKQVNNGFAILRQHIPVGVVQALNSPHSSSGRSTPSKKLSKVETLRLAVEYIKCLQKMIDEAEDETGAERNPHGRQSIIVSPNYDSSPKSEYQYHTYENYPVLLSTPSGSEMSSSPTHSQMSEESMSSTNNYHQLTPMAYNQDNYEGYESRSPDEEALLDAIFSWQQDNN